MKRKKKKAAKTETKIILGRRVKLRHKKNPRGFGILKYLYTILLLILKDSEASETHANYLKSLHGKFRVCQQQSGVLEGKPEASPLERGGGEGLPTLYVILDGTPEGCAAVTNKALLSGREGTVEFPLVGEHPSFSFSRYSAWTGLWHWRTLIASSTLNHSLFLPILTESSQSSNISVTVRT